MNFINGTDWDTRNEGQQNQHLLIKDLDVALSSLITDFEQHGMLAKTSSQSSQNLDGPLLTMIAADAVMSAFLSPTTKPAK